MRNPFKKKESDETQAQHDLRLEGGLTKIEGTGHLKIRQEHSGEEIDIIIRELNTRLDKLMNRRVLSREQISKLIEKPTLTQEEKSVLLNRQDYTDAQKQEIENLKSELLNWHMAKMVVQSATPWLRSGESKDMSDRYSKFCIFFSRNFNKPYMQELIMAAGLYLHGISHISKDVEPAPSIWVQAQPGNRYPGMDALAEGTRQTEKVSRNKD